MARRGFHTITLGCKLNQFDGAAIEGELARRGYVPRSDPAAADVVIINTCTVTAKADAEARRLARSVRRRNAGCRLLVTGCYAELDPAAIAAIPGVDGVFGNRDKARLPEILDRLGIAPPSDRGCDAATGATEALHFGDRSRAFLKIQEGCDLACSYCVIPRVRGRSRSVPPERVEAALAGLLARGYREVVLTGVNTGDWGRDLEPRLDLAALLERLLRACGPNRIRLNSLEPRTVTDTIVALMAADPRLAPHLQIPLQSGSDAVLRRMRRNYRASRYLSILERLRARVPSAAIGADVIVGFPGETDAEFEETVRLVQRSPLNYLHVFAWSARPGTDASALADRVAPARVRERSARLRALADDAGLEFRERFVGRELDAVVLEPCADAAGRRHARALTGNYIEVEVRGSGLRRGQIATVRVDRVGPEGAVATATGTPAWASAAPGA